MSAVLTLKLALVPALIGGITFAEKRWGPAVAGWLSAFPVVAGPILLFIALEQGSSFAETAAMSTYSAILAIVVFGLSYSWSATKFSWVISLAISFICYLIAVLLLNSFTPPFVFIVPFVLAVLVVAPRLYPDRVLPNSVSSAPGIDIFLRMVAGAVLVLLITHFASDLGAHMSGLLAMFPVMASVLVVFTHHQSSGVFAIHLLRGTVLGYYAFAGFCLVLTLMLPSFSIAYCFLAAFCVAIAIQAVTRGYLLRRLTRYESYKRSDLIQRVDAPHKSSEY